MVVKKIRKTPRIQMIVKTNFLSREKTTQNDKFHIVKSTHFQRWKYMYEGMDPGIKRECEERVTCGGGGSGGGIASEDLGSKLTQPADQQSETLNLTKVLLFLTNKPLIRLTNMPAAA